jgi:hypothetical protein
MDSQRNTAVLEKCQEPGTIFSSNELPTTWPTGLPPADRHDLLRASFRLFGYRLGHGIPVLREDIERLAVYADDAVSSCEVAS